MSQRPISTFGHIYSTIHIYLVEEILVNSVASLSTPLHHCGCNAPFCLTMLRIALLQY